MKIMGGVLFGVMLVNIVVRTSLKAELQDAWQHGFVVLALSGLWVWLGVRDAR
jgi:hypothetical protein